MCVFYTWRTLYVYIYVCFLYLEDLVCIYMCVFYTWRIFSSSRSLNTVPLIWLGFRATQLKTGIRNLVWIGFLIFTAGDIHYTTININISITMNIDVYIYTYNIDIYIYI